MKKLIYSLAGVFCVFCSTLNADHHKATVNLAGKWDASASMNEFESRDSVFTIRKNGDKWAVSMVNEEGVKQDMDRVELDGKTLAIAFDFERDGNKGVIGAKADLQKDGSLSGKWFVRSEDGVEQMSNDWKAVRSLPPVFAGKWDVVAHRLKPLKPLKPLNLDIGFFRNGGDLWWFLWYRTRPRIGDAALASFYSFCLAPGNKTAAAPRAPQARLPQ